MIQIFDEVEKAIKARQIKVLIFCSGKKDSFIAGADIDKMYPNTDETRARESSEAGQRFVERLANLSVPSLAAVNGACLGAGLEIAMACTYRVASDNSQKVSLGLPETKLGLLPGAGGTVRLPRLVGLQESLKIILPGGAVKPHKALQIGLIDRIIPAVNRHPHEFRFPPFVVLFPDYCLSHTFCPFFSANLFFLLPFPHILFIVCNPLVLGLCEQILPRGAHPCQYPHRQVAKSRSEGFFLDWKLEEQIP